MLLIFILSSILFRQLDEVQIVLRCRIRLLLHGYLTWYLPSSYDPYDKQSTKGSNRRWIDGSSTVVSRLVTYHSALL